MSVFICSQNATQFRIVIFIFSHHNGTCAKLNVGVCGTLSGQSMSSIPLEWNNNFCATGNISSNFTTVSGVGWSWKCTPTAGGTAVSCSVSSSYTVICNGTDVVPSNGCDPTSSLIAVNGRGCCPENASPSYACFQCAVDPLDPVGGGGGCFVAGTQVSLADGTEKDIEKVQIGEQLLGADGSINTVLDYYRPVLEHGYLYSINTLHYFVTDSHPFMTTEGWKSLSPEATEQEMPGFNVSPLQVGDTIVTLQGEEQVSTLGKSPLQTKVQLYNFVVDGNNSYYANGYLVHNKTAKYQCESGNTCCLTCNTLYGSTTESEVTCYNRCVTACTNGQNYSNLGTAYAYCVMH